MNSISTICRVCRKSKNGSSDFVSLFLKQETGFPESSLAAMLEFVGSISVSPAEENMPQEICAQCLDQMKAAYNFRKLCIESDDFLRKTCKPEAVQPIISNKSNLVYLHNYDPSFYELLLDRYYYMELNFIVPRCCGCRQAFPSYAELQAHSFDEHKQHQAAAMANQCSICYSRFPYADALHHHRQSMQSNVFCCRECFLVLERKHTLFSHLRTEHGCAEYELEREMYVEEDHQMGHSIFDPDPEPNLIVTNVQSLADPNADPYHMGYCEITPDLKLSDLRSTQYRFSERTDGFSIIEFTWHRCCACNHMFMNQSDLDIHCTEEHRLRYNQSSFVQSKPFLCELCWRRFKKKSLLALHQKFNRKKVYSCNACLHIFFGGPAYEKHLPACNPSGLKPLQLTSADEAAYVGHPMMQEEPNEEDDDDVYILND